MPNQTLVYALACLRELARFPGELVEVAKIAQRQAVPLAYCQKVLHALAQAGIVESVRGRGFSLMRPLQAISMAEMMTALEKRHHEETAESSLETLVRQKFVAHLRSMPVTDILSASL